MKQCLDCQTKAIQEISRIITLIVEARNENDDEEEDDDDDLLPLLRQYVELRHATRNSNTNSGNEDGENENDDDYDDEDDEEEEDEGDDEVARESEQSVKSRWEKECSLLRSFQETQAHRLTPLISNWWKESHPTFDDKSILIADKHLHHHCVICDDPQHHAVVGISSCAHVCICASCLSNMWSNQYSVRIKCPLCRSKGFVLPCDSIMSPLQHENKEAILPSPTATAVLITNSSNG